MSFCRRKKIYTGKEIWVYEGRRFEAQLNQVLLEWIESLFLRGDNPPTIYMSSG